MLQLSSHNAINVKRNMRMANFHPSEFNFAMDNKAIRRINLAALKKTFKTWVILSEKTGIDVNALSQYKSGYRELGDNAVKRIEAGLQKPDGWMDALHENETLPTQVGSDTFIADTLIAREEQFLREDEMPLITMFRKLNSARKSEVHSKCASLFYENNEEAPPEPIPGAVRIKGEVRRDKPESERPTTAGIKHGASARKAAK